MNTIQLKYIARCFLAFWLSGVSCAWAEDSSTFTLKKTGSETTYTAKPTPYINRAPYLLSSGAFNKESYENVYSIKYSRLACDDATNSAGPYCLYELQVSRGCKTGFAPYVVITPTSTWASNNAHTYVCPSYGNVRYKTDFDELYGSPFPWNTTLATMPQNSSGTALAGANVGLTKDNWYVFNVHLSAYYKLNASGPPTLTPNISFKWAMYCYPVNSYPSTSDNPTCGGGHFLQKPFLLESGFILASSSGVGEQIINTSRSCPKNYKPFATINWSEIKGKNFQAWGLKTTEILTSLGACIKKIEDFDTTKSKYKITYLAQTNKLSVTFNTGGFFEIDEVSRHTSLGDIHWEVYCYPPALTPPFDYYIDSPTDAGNTSCVVSSPSSTNKSPYIQ